MTLEELVQPIQWVDEQIHREYEKIGTRSDEKHPKLRYWVASGLSLVSTHLNIY